MLLTGTPALADRQRFEALKAGLDARAGGQHIVAAWGPAFSTGFEEFDGVLRGGFPRGALSTLEGAASSGRTAILAASLARATQSGFAAVVDDGALYPPDLARAGVRLDRLFVVSAASPSAIARAADITLRSRAFGVVAMPALPLRATIWSRFCGLANKSGTALLALGMHASPELASFAATRVRCTIEHVLWSGQSGLFCQLAGYDIHVQVLKHRRTAPGATASVRVSNGQIENSRSRRVDAAVRARSVV
jgi:hypothetical protein